MAKTWTDLVDAVIADPQSAKNLAALRVSVTAAKKAPGYKIERDMAEQASALVDELQMYQEARDRCRAEKNEAKAQQHEGSCAAVASKIGRYRQRMLQERGVI